MTCRITINCDCNRRRKNKLRLVPTLSVQEQTEPVLPTPTFYSRRRGVLLMALELTATQQSTVTISAKDKKGNPARFDGVPTWSTNNTDVLAIVPSPDGLTAVVSAVGPLGEAGVTVLADADIGDGVTELIGTLDVTVGPGTATVIELTPGPAEEQP